MSSRSFKNADPDRSSMELISDDGPGNSKVRPTFQKGTGMDTDKNRAMKVTCGK